MNRANIISSIHNQYFVGYHLCSFSRYSFASFHDIYNLYQSQETASVLFFHHAFFVLEARIQDDVLAGLSRYDIPFFLLEYSLAERTIEWLCGWTKYVKEYTASKELHYFLKQGGVYGMLHRNNYTPHCVYRCYTTQEVVLLC